MMDKLISDFTANINEALKIGAAYNFKQPGKKIHNILFCGMGGSGFGGKLVARWVEDQINVPFTVVQDYTIPQFVDENTLVIGSSYSGNTEETLISVEAARKKGAQIVCISSGGSLTKFCADYGFDCVIVPGGNPPRTALAYSMVQIANILVKFGFVNHSILDDLEKAGKLIQQDLVAIQKEARFLASFFFQKFTMIYTETKYEAIGIRARQQFNENGKILCACNVIPEMNHNELVGWGTANDEYAALFIYTSDMNPRNKTRMDISYDLIASKTKNTHKIVAVGNSQIEQSIHLIHILDWASYYITDLNGVDVIEVKVIDHLKNELAKM